MAPLYRMNRSTSWTQSGKHRSYERNEIYEKGAPGSCEDDPDFVLIRLWRIALPVNPHQPINSETGPVLSANRSGRAPICWTIVSSKLLRRAFGFTGLW